MKKLLTLIFALGLTFTVSGCSSVDPAMLVLKLSAQDGGFSLVGDEVVLSSGIFLKDGSVKDLVATVEKRVGDSTWSVDQSKKLTEINANESFKTKVTEAGTYTFRVSVGTNDKPDLKTSEEVAIVVKDLKLEVRNLYYNEQQACSSDAKCAKFSQTNNYPGLFDYKDSKVKAAYARTQVIASGTPDVGSLLATPEWSLQKKACEPFLLTKPDQGRTFMVTLESDVFGKYDVHVNYLNGKLYYFSGPNFGC